jgi:hypothetical protein
MYLVARWMVDRGHSGFQPLVTALEPLQRAGHVALVRAVARLRAQLTSQGFAAKKKGWPPSAVLAFLLACSSCDDALVRRQCLATVVRRMTRRALHMGAEGDLDVKA